MKLFLALALIIFPGVARCQNLPSLDVLLDRLDAYARQYQATLPSLSCDEKVTSQGINSRGKATSVWEIQSTLREVRTEDPYAPFTEKRALKSVNGRRPKPAFRTSELPYFVQGGFAGLVGFKRWEQRECFDYLVTPANASGSVRLEMTLKPNFAKSSCAGLPAGFQRIVIADPETGRVLHTERTIAPEIAEENDEVYFGEIDYAPQKLGEQTFWLPSRFYSHDAGDSGRMLALYSNCHRYTGELKILPNAVLPATGPEPR